MRDEILELQSCHATTMARMAEYRRNLIHLSHRVLKVGVLPLHINPNRASSSSQELQYPHVHSEPCRCMHACWTVLVVSLMFCSPNCLCETKVSVATIRVLALHSMQCLTPYHLTHNLQVMVAQETLRKSGYAVQQDEEQLRCVMHYRINHSRSYPCYSLHSSLLMNITVAVFVHMNVRNGITTLDIWPAQCPHHEFAPADYGIFGLGVEFKHQTHSIRTFAAFPHFPCTIGLLICTVQLAFSYRFNCLNKRCMLCWGEFPHACVPGMEITAIYFSFFCPID